jgi:hypothetical protein
MKEILNIDIEEWVLREMCQEDFRTGVKMLALKVRKMIKKGETEGLEDYIRNQVLEISNLIIKNPEGTAQTAVFEVFSDDEIRKMIKKARKRKNEKLKNKKTANDRDIDSEDQDESLNYPLLQNLENLMDELITEYLMKS